MRRNKIDITCMMESAARVNDESNITERCISNTRRREVRVSGLDRAWTER